MVIYSAVQSRCYIINMNNTGMGLHRHFSIDRQSRHFACPFQAADYTMQMGVHTTLYPFYTTKEILRQQYQKYTSLAARFLFTLYKSDFLLSAVIVSLPLLATDAFKSHMRLNAYYRHLKWTFVAMLLLRNEGHFRTIRTQVSQPASGGNVTDMSEL